MKINLNADLGESYGAWTMGRDDSLLQVVDSANVACGFHAGDPLVMTSTVRLARAAAVGIGAHPAFPDLQGFGRREMHLPDAELAAVVIYQLSALAGICRSEGTRMTHVKPHGALNNMAADNRALADIIASSIARVDSRLVLLAPALSALADAGKAHDLPTALEIFADRRYSASGSLLPRSQPEAVIDSTDACVAHVRDMLDANGIVTADGEVLPTPFHSICVHGDNDHALDTARALRTALTDDGHQLLGLSDLLNA